MEAISEFFSGTGFALLFQGGNWKMLIMIAVACFLLYLAIVKKYEPLLLLPIAFGMLLANLPGAGLLDPPSEFNNNVGGLLYYLDYGVKLGIYPALIFLGVGAMTDFGPLIANPKSLILGAAAQIGIFLAFLLALALGFPAEAAASIGIIGGADGPTTIFTTSRLLSYADWYDNDRGIFVYGAGSGDSASDYETVYNQKRTPDSNEAASSRF